MIIDIFTEFPLENRGVSGLLGRISRLTVKVLRERAAFFFRAKDVQECLNLQVASGTYCTTILILNTTTQKT